MLQTLETALAGTRNTLDEYRSTPQLDAFLELVSAGVSAELLRALATVTQDVSESAVTLDFAQEQSSARRVEFSFTAEESPILERASRRLLEDLEPQSATIIGSVTMVTRPRPGEHGVARILVEAGADVKNVRVRIDPDQYADIVDAHRDDLKLEVSGRLERDRKYYWMYGTTGIRVLEPDDDIGEPASRSVVRWLPTSDGR